MANKRIYDLEKQSVIANDHAVVIDKSGQDEATYTSIADLFSKFQDEVEITEEQISDFGEYLTSISGLNISELTNDSFFIASNTTGVTGADQITNIMSLTTAEYEAIGSPDSSTLYIITDA